jgi:VanZ family protein
MEYYLPACPQQLIVMSISILSLVRRWSGWLLLCWLIFVLLLTVVPTPKSINSLDVGTIEIRLDYLYHIIMYLAGTFLAILWSVGLLKPPYTSLFWRRTALAAALMILLAVGQEFLQKLIPYRAFNINDIISNISGVILGEVLTIIIILRSRT